MYLIFLYVVLFATVFFQESRSIGDSIAFVTACTKYQDTEAEVEAIFTDGDGLETQRMFITNLVTVHSNAPDVASILGRNKIIGNSVGVSEISVNLPNTQNILVTSDTVHVSNSMVEIVDLQVSAITGASSSASDPLDMYSNGMLSFDLHQNLTFDGMRAGVSVFANYSDGTWADVTARSLVKSLSPQLTASVDDMGPLITVNDYSHSETGGLVEASLPVCYRAEPVISTGLVKMDIEPIQVLLTPEFGTLAQPGDLAAEPPFSLPAETRASVSILFKDGNVRNFTDGFLSGLNTRAIIEVVPGQGSDLVEVLDGNLLRVLPGATNGTAFLNVHFPGTYGINGSAVIKVTGFLRTEVVFVPYPHNPGILKNTVYRLDCSERRQRLRLVALAALSSGEFVDVTENATFLLNETFADAGHLTTLPNGTTIFVADNIGTAYVMGEIGGGRSSFWTPIKVLDESTSIVRLELTGHAPNDTLRGYSGSEWDFLSLTAFFADGTYYPEIIRGITSEWVQAHELVVFGSTNTHAVSVNEFAVLTQHYNYYAEIFISAVQHQQCHGMQAVNYSEIMVYSNLKPRTFDFDLGSQVGPKFGTVEVDAPMDVPVSVQAFANAPLTAFHIILQFDPEVVAVDDDGSCVGNPAWTGFFECTTNNPPGEVILAGVCGIGGCIAEDFITFANVRFYPKKQGQSYVTGFIRRVEDATHCLALHTVFAGADDVHVDPNGLTATPTGQITAGPSTPHPTHLPTPYSGNETLFPGVFTLACPLRDNCHSCVMGDVNADCVFDAGDARALEQIITLGALSQGTGSYTSCQLTAMDANRDGLVDYLDVVFLLRVMTKKYRFLTHMEVTYDRDSGLLVAVDLREPSGESINNNSATLSYSLATNQSSQLDITLGTRVATTVPSLAQIDSVYNPASELMEIQSAFIGYELNFAIAVTVRTFDDRGRSTPRRVFTYYCSPFMDSSGVCVHSLTGSRFDGYFSFDLKLYEPSSVPSGAPTHSVIHRDRFVSLVHPIISSVDGPAMPVVDYPKLHALSQWSVPFDTMIGAVPGAGSTFGLSIAGRQYNSVSFTVPRRPTAVVAGVVKTSLLYEDKPTLSVAFQLTDLEGHTQVEHTSLLMEVNCTVRGLSATFACLTPDPASGIGSCAGDISATWFDTVQTVGLSVRVFSPDSAVSTPFMPVTLERSPVRTIPVTVAAPFMRMLVPASPVIPGDTFTVAVTVDTGVKSLASWSVSLSFDFALLEFVSQSVGEVYSAATADTSLPGTVDISCPGVNPVGSGATTGPAVDVMTLTMRVLPGANGGLHAGVLSLFVYALVDEVTASFLQNTYAFVQDHRDFGEFVSADLAVLPSEIVGVFAYAPQNEMVNTATIDGVDIFSNVFVVGVTNSPSEVSTLVTSASECSVRANATAGMDVVTNSGQKCVVKLSSHKTSGFSKGMVDVDYNQFRTSVPFRIWQPQTIKVKLTDAILNSIEPAV